MGRWSVGATLGLAIAPPTPQGATLNRTITQALKHVWLQEADSKEHRFVFPRLTDDIQGLYNDLKVTHDVLLTIFPEFWTFAPTWVCARSSPGCG